MTFIQQQLVGIMRADRRTRGVHTSATRKASNGTNTDDGVARKRGRGSRKSDGHA